MEKPTEENFDKLLWPGVITSFLKAGFNDEDANRLSRAFIVENGGKSDGVMSRLKRALAAATNEAVS